MGSRKQYFITSVAILLVVVSALSLVRYLTADQHKVFHFLTYLVDILSIIIAWALFNRRRRAYYIALALIIIDLLLGLARLEHSESFHVGRALLLAADVYMIVVLLIFQRSFKWKTEKFTESRAIPPLIVALATLGFAWVLTGTAEGVFEILTGTNKPLENVICVVFWLSVALALYLVLKPRVFDATKSRSLRSYARGLVQRYGQNPSSYLSLENDKTLFFGENVEGVVAYGVAGDVIVVLGDPIAADEDFVRLLAEFQAFCREHGMQCIFLGTTDKYLDCYSLLGYRYVKAGEEARFELSEYTLSGKKMQKMRMNVNHANSAGLTTLEYRPNEAHDSSIEAAFEEISKSWLGGKKTGMLGFTLGSVGLEEPLDKRYFYAQDESGKIVAFSVFVPFMGMDGYLADVTRRLDDAPGGVTEKLAFDAFMQFKEEGLRWGSLGNAPLANVREGEVDSKTAELLEFMYENGNAFYGFKALYSAKKKYSPTSWEPSYFVYSTAIMTPQMTWAMAKIQNPAGMLRGYGLSLFRSLRKKAKSE